MMKNVLWISALLMLSACTVSADVPNRVTVKSDGSVTIGTSSNKSGGGAYQNGNFCPPGQEKKGNCHH